jgi:hypothetical protein
MSQNIVEVCILTYSCIYIILDSESLPTTGGDMEKKVARVTEYGETQAKVVDLLIGLATVRIAIGDIKAPHKKLTTSEKRLVGEHQKTVRALSKEIIQNLQKLAVHEQVQMALAYPILGDLVTKSLHNIPPKNSK